MLHLLPKKIPDFNEMLADIGRPENKKLARALGVSERTVRNWRAKNDAPLPVRMAVFWITSWGQSWVNTDAMNLAQLQANQNNVLKHALAKAEREAADLRTQIERLGQLGDFGSANDPVSGVTGPGPAQARPEPITLTFDTFDSGMDWRQVAQTARPEDAKVWRTGT